MNTVLHGAPDPPQLGGGRVGGGILPTVDPLHISRLAEARDLKFCMHVDGWGPDENYAKAFHRGSGSQCLLLIFQIPSYLWNG